MEINLEVLVPGVSLNKKKTGDGLDYLIIKHDSKWIDLDFAGDETGSQIYLCSGEVVLGVVRISEEVECFINKHKNETHLIVQNRKKWKSFIESGDSPGPQNNMMSELQNRVRLTMSTVLTALHFTTSMGWDKYSKEEPEFQCYQSLEELFGNHEGVDFLKNKISELMKNPESNKRELETLFALNKAHIK